MPNQHTARWTAEEDRFLREHHAEMTMQQMADTIGRSKIAVQSRCSLLGLCKVHKWTPEEDTFLRDNYLRLNNTELYEALKLPPCPAPKQAIANRLRRLVLKRPEQIREKMKADTQLQKGHKTWNKGKYVRLSPRTEFKKGNLPHNTKRDGAVTIRVYKQTGVPYKYIRIASGKWALLHRHNWQRAHGPVPQKHVIAFKNGDTLDCRLENLQCISMAENARRNRNSKKAAASMRKNWANNRHLQHDSYIAATLSRRNPELRAELLKHPEIIEAKRQQLTLQRRLKHDQATDA